MLRAGIIGLGVGEQHIIGYSAHPEVSVVSACDFDQKKLSEVQSRHPDLTYHSEAKAI
jgi:predicted dehydrogenase